MTNYFELYGLPVSFKPDAAIVKNKYYELSRGYHPDRYARATPAEQANALRMSAMNNDAYKTLNNADATMAYVLKLHSLLGDEEKYSLPPDFLMEMMELNEAVSEYELEPSNADMAKEALGSLNGQLSAWQQEADALVEKYESGDHSSAVLQEIKEYYFRKKYLLRIQERIDKFAAR